MDFSMPFLLFGANIKAQPTSHVHSHRKTGWTYVSIYHVYPRSIQDPDDINQCKNLLAADLLFLTKTCKLICWYPGWDSGIISVQPPPYYWHYALCASDIMESFQGLLGLNGLYFLVINSDLLLFRYLL